MACGRLGSSTRNRSNGRRRGQPPVLGASWDLEHVVADHDVRHVVVTFSTAPHDVLLGVVRRCRELGVEVSVVPRLFEVEGERVSVARLGALPLITTHFVDPKGWQFRAKYAVERLIAGLALIVTLPLIAAAMIAVRLTMGQPGRLSSEASRHGRSRVRDAQAAHDEGQPRGGR